MNILDERLAIHFFEHYCEDLIGNAPEELLPVISTIYSLPLEHSGVFFRKSISGSRFEVLFNYSGKDFEGWVDNIYENIGNSLGDHDFLHGRISFTKKNLNLEDSDEIVRYVRPIKLNKGPPLNIRLEYEYEGR